MQLAPSISHRGVTTARFPRHQGVCWRHGRVTCAAVNAAGDEAEAAASASSDGSNAGSPGDTAISAGSAEAQPSSSGVGSSSIRLPKTGLLAMADPKQEVYSRAGEKFDPTKRGGRYKPEFIWQTNWQEALKREEDLARQRADYQRRAAEGEAPGASGPGALGLSRLYDLDDVSVDLTEQLVKPRKAGPSNGASRSRPTSTSSGQSSAGPAARRPARTAAGRAAQARELALSRRLEPGDGAESLSPSYKLKDLPTRGEARRFARATRATERAGAVPLSAVGQLTPEEAAARAAQRELERQRYEMLKVEFQGWTLAMALVGAAAAYYCYGRDTAIGYSLGASAGLTYLRLLARSIDSVGDASLGGNLSGAIGQPRLLIPVVLALTYNRWNALYADQFGIHLDLLSMLLGFFTYKMAVLGRQTLQLMSDFTAAQEVQRRGSSGTGVSEAGSGSEGSTGEDADSDAQGAMTLDRIFVRRALTE